MLALHRERERERERGGGGGGADTRVASTRATRELLSDPTLLLPPPPPRSFCHAVANSRSSRRRVEYVSPAILIPVINSLIATARSCNFTSGVFARARARYIGQNSVLTENVELPRVLGRAALNFGILGSARDGLVVVQQSRLEHQRGARRVTVLRYLQQSRHRAI